MKILVALMVPLMTVHSTYPNFVDHAKIPFPNGALSKQSVSGFIPISNASNTFYWLFLSDTGATKKPTIVWVQGQIGVSSMFGVVNEFTPNWLRDFNILFVDAPVGTGFSFTSSLTEMASTSEEIASQMYQFLLGFFVRHAKDVGTDIIIAGEDYAGHTIPVLSALILHEPVASFNLKGIAGGNTHVHAPIQVITKAESAGMFGLVDGSCIEEARRHAWAASAYSVAGETMESLNERNLLEQTIQTCSPGIDMSNIGHMVSKPSELLEKLENWMNTPSARAALNVSLPLETKVWAKNETVFNRLKPDIMRVMWDYIPPILDSGVRMLLYQGQLDWVDGVYSNEAWINALNWSGAEGYARSPRQPWSAGYLRTYGPLTEAMLLNTGHLAIRENPDDVLNLFKEIFLSEKPGPPELGTSVVVV